jgi:predicted ATPase/transcriptional regulator with XRE-family HTH domain
MSDDATFGAWLRRLRRAHDLTQEALAERAGCAVETLRAVESGRRRPSRELAAIFARELAVPAPQRDRFIALARGVVAPAPVVPAAPAAPATPAPAAPAAPPLAAGEPLIGRDAELAAARARLENPGCRLLTVVGPGGSGKTRLALQLARELAPAYPDGAHVVMLAGAATSAAARASLAAALGIPAGGGGDLGPRVVERLRASRALLLLDNLEQLTADDGLTALLAALLDDAPGVRVLATSRVHLGLRAEWTFELGGLAIGGEPGAGPAAAELLFAERAGRLRRDFAVTPRNAAAVAEVCRIVGGLPLAIELAAAWVTVLSPAEIAAEIARDLDLLSAAARDAAPSHRSMRAVFERSWQLLDAEQQRALAALSLFRGGFTREAAGAVAGARLPVLAELIRHSLLRREGRRYVLHELIRQFCAERLRASGDQAAVEERFVRHLHAFAAEQLDVRLADAEAQRVGRVRDELDNLRAGMELGLARPELLAAAAGICVSMEHHWSILGHATEPIGWAERLLAAGPLPPLARARLHLIGAHAATLLGDTARALAAGAAGLAAARESGDESVLRRALHNLGTAEGLFGDAARGEGLLREAIVISRRQGNHYAEAGNLNNLGLVMWQAGRLADALATFEAATAVARAGSLRFNLAAILASLAGVEALLGRPDAAAHAREALALALEFGDAATALEVVEVLGALAALAGDRPRAALLLGAAAAERERSRIPLDPWRHVAYAQYVRDARGPLDDRAWERALAPGRALPFPEAAALAAQG